MKVTLIAHTPEPEKAVACAAKLCYANSGIDELYNGLTTEKAANFVQMLASYGHESPIEHVSFTFGVDGISRACSHQLVRHRLASYSQQSQRYVDMDNFSYITPPEIKADSACLDLYNQAMEQCLKSYQTLTKSLSDSYVSDFLKSGMGEKKALSEAQKKAQEDARFVLPNACETKIIVTMNARTLVHFFNVRCCNRAQWEIKAVADEMLRLVVSVAPTLFSAAGPACYKGVCNEGGKSCNKSMEMREFYKRIHTE